MNQDGNVCGTSRSSQNACAVLVGILMVGSAMLGFMPSVIAQSMGQLEPPYSDYGLDIDLPPDGLFDYLVVNLSVNVT